MLASFAGMAYQNAVLISRLKSQAAALQESQTINEFVLAATGVGLYQRDLTTNRSTSSRSLTTLLELGDDPTLEELRQRLQPDDREALIAATNRALAERGDYQLDVKVTLSSGAVRDIYARGRVTVDAHGEPDRLMGAFIDVTERRLLEAQLRQAQKMEIIGRMSSGVAHDFNNLLTVIAGYARFIESELTNEVSRNDIGEILKAVDRATALTRQLLAFSRKRARELSVFDVNALITDLSSMARRLLGEHVTLIDLARSRRAAHPRRSWPGRAGAPQSRDQCARRHAARRRVADQHARHCRCDRLMVEHCRHRYRNGDVAGRAGSDLRAVLHHQARRQGHRPRPCDRPRDRQRIRRPHQRR